MSSEAIRIESETLSALRERSAQTGEPIVRLAQRYIGEGMRLDRHPGIIFRDGPAGRRAVVIGGPDVWEVIAAARSASERGEELVRALAERIGVPVERIRIAVSYYGEYPDEVDRFIAANDQEAEQLERALETERRLVGGGCCWTRCPRRGSPSSFAREAAMWLPCTIRSIGRSKGSQTR